MVIVDKKKYKKIKMRMVELELNQTDLAQKFGVSKQTISAIIRGIAESKRLRNEIEKELKIEIWEN